MTLAELCELKKFDVEFAELHTPLFLGGKNHGLKLKASHDLQLLYVRDWDKLLVSWKNSAGEHPTVVPISNVANMWPAKVAPKPVEAPKPPQGKITAQVDTPQSHVFAGEGKGKR